MSSPALYCAVRTVEQHKPDILNGAKKIMHDKGMTGIEVTSSLPHGRTSTVHAAVVAAKKHNPPSPGEGLGTSAPATYIVFFTTAGADAKAVLADLLDRWDPLGWL